MFFVNVFRNQQNIFRTQGSHFWKLYFIFLWLEKSWQFSSLEFDFIHIIPFGLICFMLLYSLWIVLCLFLLKVKQWIFMNMKLRLCQVWLNFIFVSYLKTSLLLHWFQSLMKSPVSKQMHIVHVLLVE